MVSFSDSHRVHVGLFGVSQILLLYCLVMRVPSWAAIIKASDLAKMRPSFCHKYELFWSTSGDSMVFLFHGLLIL